MNQRNSTKPKSISTMHGLSLSGTVIDRTRRMVPHDNPTTEIVTYTIQDGGTTVSSTSMTMPPMDTMILNPMCAFLYTSRHIIERTEIRHTHLISKNPMSREANISNSLITVILQAVNISFHDVSIAFSLFLSMAFIV